jgi:hypothetical protein
MEEGQVFANMETEQLKEIHLTECGIVPRVLERLLRAKLQNLKKLSLSIPG